MSEHRARYKNLALNPSELRRRREEGSIQLRKQKRDVLSNKRRLHQAEPIVDDFDFQTCDDQLTQQTLEDLKQNEDLSLIFESARRIRKLLSKEPDPLFDEVLQSGIMPRLVELLDCYASPSIQFEVTWILTNISSSITEHTRAVAESGAVPKLVQLAQSEDVKLQEQAIWALGNIIGDGTELRDEVIRCGFIPTLLRTIDPNNGISFIRNLAWVVVNLCRYNDPPIDLEIVKQLIPKIKVLLSIPDDKILIDSTWAISYIIELGPEYYEHVLDQELVEKMIPLLEIDEPRLITSTVRAFGCMAAGTNEQTQIIIDSGALPVLSKVLRNNNPKVAKDILWLISNVAAGTTEQVQAIIDSGFVSSIVHYLRVGDFAQQKEATWAIFNLTVSGSNDQLKILVDEHAVQALCDLLTLTDLTTLKRSLESLKNLLHKCEEVTIQVEECGGLDKIESLQNNLNQEIYELAYEIIDIHFSQSDMDK